MAHGQKRKRYVTLRLLAAALRALGWLGVKTELLILEREGESSVEPQSGADPFQYRFLTKSDIDEMIRLEPDSVRHDIEEMFKTGKLCFGVFDGTRLVAKMWCDLDEIYHPINSRTLDDDEVYLQLAFVDPDYRGQSLAPRLRIAGFAALREMGRTRFYSYSRYFNMAARRFKEKLGSREEALIVHIRLFGKWSKCITLPRSEH